MGARQVAIRIEQDRAPERDSLRRGRGERVQNRAPAVGPAHGKNPRRIVADQEIQSDRGQRLLFAFVAVPFFGDDYLFRAIVIPWLVARRR